MQFRLMYSGRLLGASRNDTRASLKHEIRREFSPQLKRLWETNRNLLRYAERQGAVWLGQHHEEGSNLPRGDEEQRVFLIERGLRHEREAWSRAGQGFIPLVTEEMGLRCKLDVLFLRPEEKAFVMESGDLDNRVKTLFDALRMPKNADEMGNLRPIPEPIYCLLEDDRMVSEVRVNADHLLLLPRESEITANDVFLVIEVSLEAPPNSPYEWIFG
jgi:hypothetical protein